MTSNAVHEAQYARLLAGGFDTHALDAGCVVHGPACLPLGDDEVKARFTLYYIAFSGERYIIGVLGDPSGAEPVLLRIESACAFGHIFGSLQCDCGWQWRCSLRTIIEAGRGVLVYAVDQDARGSGIAAHFDIYQLRQQENLDTDEVFRRIQRPWDSRDYRIIPKLLRAIGVSSIALLSNNHERLQMLRDAGFVVDHAPLEAELTVENMSTLMLEKEDLGYLWSFATHADILEPLQAVVEGDLERVAATLSAPGTVPRANVEATWETVCDALQEFASTLSLRDRRVLYLTDLPRLHDIEAYAKVGVRTIVVPYRHLPHLLREACSASGIRLVDWSRRNAWKTPRPQWAPVEATAERHSYRKVGLDLELLEGAQSRSQVYIWNGES